AKLHRLVARPGCSRSSSVTCIPAEASRAATDAPRIPAPITTQRRDDIRALSPVSGAAEPPGAGSRWRAEPDPEVILQGRAPAGRDRDDVGQGPGVGDDGEVAFGVARVVVN